jgi:hypothetical protein
MTLPTSTNANLPLMLELAQGDCLDLLATIPDGFVDLITADLPYGTTRCPWDSMIPLDAIWSEFRRILTPTGTVVATSAGLFTVDMISAARDLYKYGLVWNKSRPSQFAHSRNRPMVNHEDIVVFSRGTCQHASISKRRMTFNPVDAVDNEVKVLRRMKSRAMGNCNSQKIGEEFMTRKNFPRSIQYHPNPYRPEHETQKPESLLEWMIEHYSNPGDMVLDPTMGSGTAGVAAVRLGRSFVGMERDPKYFEYAEKRILTERDNPQPKSIPDLLRLAAPDNDDAYADSDTVA